MSELANFVAVQDVAIILAKKAGTLRVDEFISRFGDVCWAICDDVGTIEVVDNAEELEYRIAI